MASSSSSSSKQHYSAGDGSSGGIPVLLRVKRKRTEEPAEALIIASKLMKLENGCGADPAREAANVFHFAGTVRTPGESPREVLTNVSQQKDHSALVKPNPFSKLSISDYQDERREAKKAHSSQRRFRLISQHRRLDEKESVEAADSHASVEVEKTASAGTGVTDGVCLYDLEEEDEEEEEGATRDEDGSGGVSPGATGSSCTVESVITCNSTPMVRERVSASRNDYVYDVYLTHARSMADMYQYNWSHVSACAIDQPLVHEVLNSEEECYDDEEDSNDEGHWRNDYPDEMESDLEGEESEDERMEGYRGKDSYIGCDNEEDSYLDSSW